MHVVDLTVTPSSDVVSHSRLDSGLSLIPTPVTSAWWQMVAVVALVAAAERPERKVRPGASERIEGRRANDAPSCDRVVLRGHARPKDVLIEPARVGTGVRAK